MKKLLLIALMAIAASAGMVEQTSVAYGNVEATAKAGGIEATFKTKTTSFRQSFGYEFAHIRALGFLQVDKYKDEVITSTEGNAVSYGVDVAFIHTSDNGVGVAVGAMLGKGTKDLGSDGDSVGVSELNFTDMAMRAGVTYTVESWLLEAGVENKMRYYDDLVISGIAVELEEEIQSVYVAARYKF